MKTPSDTYYLGKAAKLEKQAENGKHTDSLDSYFRAKMSSPITNNTLRYLQPNSLSKLSLL